MGFPICNECWTCAAGCAGCLAGNGDDDYSPASAHELINRIMHNKYPEHRDAMISFLKDHYAIDFNDYKNLDFDQMVLDETNIAVQAQNRLLDKELRILNSQWVGDVDGNKLVKVPNKTWYLGSNGNKMFDYFGYMFVLVPTMTNHNTYTLHDVYVKA